MNLRDRLSPGVRSVESFRESMGVPRPASVREMLTREIALRFVGFHCFGETDELSASDEPYFTFGVLPAVIERKDPAHGIHENVDAGESVAKVLELFTRSHFIQSGREFAPSPNVGAAGGDFSPTQLGPGKWESVVRRAGISNTGYTR